MLFGWSMLVRTKSSTLLTGESLDQHYIHTFQDNVIRLRGYKRRGFTSAYSQRRGANESECGGSRPPPCPNWSTTQQTRVTGGSRGGSPKVLLRSETNTKHLVKLADYLFIFSPRALHLGLVFNREQNFDSRKKSLQAIRPPILLPFYRIILIKYQKYYEAK